MLSRDELIDRIGVLNDRISISSAPQFEREIRIITSFVREIGGGPGFSQYNLQFLIHLYLLLTSVSEMGTSGDLFHH